MKILLFILVISLSYLSGSDVVPVASKNIKWKEQLTSKKIKIVDRNNKYKCKKHLNINDLKEKKLRAKHYILKNSTICAEDVYIAKVKKVLFNFGSLEIEKDGEIVKETDKYIKIKNLDGKIEKIYKDELGR